MILHNERTVKNVSNLFSLSPTLFSYVRTLDSHLTVFFFDSLLVLTDTLPPVFTDQVSANDSLPRTSIFWEPGISNQWTADSAVNIAHLDADNLSSTDMDVERYVYLFRSIPAIPPPHIHMHCCTLRTNLTLPPSLMLVNNP
jgi:hypothetical protein